MATVTVADITTDNGVVHVIDAVILPPVETTTVADIIAGSDDHFVLAAVLDSTGLDETLAGEGPFTVFAPTDAAFDAIDPFFLLDLLHRQRRCSPRSSPTTWPAEPCSALTSAMVRPSPR